MRREDGGRIDITWPSGYTAQFDPILKVRDAAGVVVLEEGDFVDGACEIGDPAGRLMDPPFLALRLDCGPLDTADCATRVRQVARANGWPARSVESLAFTSVDGGFVLRFEDGTEVRGVAPAG